MHVCWLNLSVMLESYNLKTGNTKMKLYHSTDYTLRWREMSRNAEKWREMESYGETEKIKQFSRFSLIHKTKNP